MNKEVSKKLATLLRDAGYTNIPLKVYDAEDENDNTLYPYGEAFSGDNELYAPTIAEVVMWLYEKHDVWVSVQRDWDVGKCLGFEAIIDDNDGSINTETFNSPTEAYEAAIEYALNNLI